MDQSIFEIMSNWLKEQSIEDTVGQASSQDEQGNPYVTLCIGGVKPEGEPILLYYTRFCPELIEHFQKTLLGYLDGRKCIVWRYFPHLEHESYRSEFDGGEHHRYQIRCRLTAYPQ